MMGNIIYSNSFVDVADANITARSQATGYSKVNVMDRWNLRRRFRADDTTTNDYLMKFNFGAAQTLAAVVFFDVNFNKVKIQGNASDSWGSPSHSGTDLVVSQNATTGRFNIYAPLTDFNYQYLRVFIPTGAAAVGPYTAKFEVGTICFLSSVTELAHNMSYGYSQTARHFYKTAVNERVPLAESLRWEGKLVFGNRASSNRDELAAMNKVSMAGPFIFYENMGSTQNVYLCVRDDSIEITDFTYGGVTGNTIGIKEAYMLGES